MKRITLFTLLLAALGFAIASWLATDRAVGPRARTSLATSPEAPIAPPALVTAAPLAPEAEPTASSDAPPANARSAAPDERPRIAGRVAVEGGYPARESARVEAKVYAGRGHVLTVMAQVARDGSFELHVPKEARHALMQVRADLLEQRKPVQAAPGATDVVLEAQYLAQLSGRVRPPPGLTEAEGDMGRVRLGCGPVREDGLPLYGRGVRPAADGTFRFDRLITGRALTLSAESPWGPTWSVRLEPLAPGERRELDVVLDAGIAISGRVVDEHGAPLAWIAVTARQPITLAHGGFRIFGDTTATDQTDEAGRFEILRLGRRPWQVEVERLDLVRGAQLVVDATGGDVHDVLLTVERGGCVSGSVEWPDGRPVQSFHLRVESDARRSTTFESDGRFERCGIGAEPCVLVATADEPGVAGTVRVTDVRAGQSGLRLVLEARPVFTLSGSASDAGGEPLARFQVRARGDSERYSTDARDGRFELEGVPAGEWEIVVESAGLLTVTRTVTVGPTTEPLYFVLSPAGRVRGTVLDAAGRPVARAAVSASEGPSPFSSVEEGPADSDGRFDVEASAESIFLRARAPGHAPSETLAVSVASGETLDGIVLRLREPCRITGRVLEADGRPAVGQWIMAGRGDEHDASETDGKGEFAFEDLPHGPATVTAAREDGSVARAEVELGPGTNAVELRFESADPVRVRGTLRRNGAPVACELSFSSPAGYAWGSSGADGRFELMLRRPGSWRVSALSSEEVRNIEIVVPDAESHEVELELDEMSIGLPPY